MTALSPPFPLPSLFRDEPLAFCDRALELFRHQHRYNAVYQAYCQSLRVVPEQVRTLDRIPFLPISLFKTQDIRTGAFTAEAVFESSGTTGSVPSRHAVKDLSLYETSFQTAFERFYGAVEDLCLLALLPSYLERSHSSLVYMTRHLIARSRDTDSGFFLHDFDALARMLQRKEAEGRPVLLLGVSYALLDFSERYPMPLHHTIVMETGGMKGRREELERAELHQRLCHAFSLSSIHAEYGMTELLSQAYSAGEGRFQSPPWMKVLIRQEDDPLEVLEYPSTSMPLQGLLNIIDLANVHSCAFIATEDRGRLHADGRFEVTGRAALSDLRGCGLMYEPS